MKIRQRIARKVTLAWSLLLCMVFLGKETKAVDSIIDVGPFVDTDACYAAMFLADGGDLGDRMIFATEYITMCQELGPPGFLADVDEFIELPLALQSSFNTLACMCLQMGGPADCCLNDNAHIVSEGTGPSDPPPSSDQSQYLFTVCLSTITNIEFVLGSEEPSLAPSSQPITPSPTMTPTAAPSSPPTDPPFVAPTASPSAAPTPSPTRTLLPSKIPSSFPTETLMPSPAPSAPSVSLMPSGVPSTGVPSSTPTFVPTSETELPVQAAYLIALRDGKVTPPPADYVANLESGMDRLVDKLLISLFPVSGRVRRRRLVVSHAPPSMVIGRFNVSCPQNLSEDDLCQDITHLVKLTITTEDPNEVEEKFTDALKIAIDSGELNVALAEVGASEGISVISSETPEPSRSPTTTTAPAGGLSGAAIGGIVAGSAVLLAIAGLLWARRRSSNDDKEDGSYFPGQALQSDAVSKDLAAGMTLGAASASYGKRTSRDGSIDADGLMVNESHDSSSNAGSSGWSSSAGVSSLNTGSIDSMDGGYAAAAAGTSLAAMAAAGAAAGSRGSRRSGESVPDLPEVTRADLDTAIEAGDWAAVGATAALLAAASDSQSFSSKSRSTRSRGGSSLSSLDAARAAELDHLVDAGDWEGVVLAAAKFEASEEAASRHSGSGTAGSAAGSSAYSKGSSGEGNSRSTSLSESPSKAQKRNEIRSEVEALVRRVVPEEIDNVDEMMMQFKGREEELVETLRTMQERQVAQKARVQGQKQAKRDARRQVQEGGGVPGAPTPGGFGAGATAGIALGAAAATGVAVGAAAASGRSSSETDTDTDRAPDTASEGSARRRRTALELAIEAGDWEAVGEAAAMMSDTSITSASSAEIDALAAGESDFSDASMSSRSRRAARAGVNSERAAELDEMIDRGDWTGVVAAASRFNVSDKSSGSSSNVPTSSGSGVARASAESGSLSTVERERQQQLKEEQDALAQAEIWMAIAEQSKQEGETDAGASDAADWAIARSLSALRSAEAKGDLKGSSQETTDSGGDADSQDRSV